MNSPTSSPSKKKLRLNYFSLAFQLRYGLWLATTGLFCFFLMGLLIHLSIRHAILEAPHAEAVREALQGFLSPRAIFLGYDVFLPAGILAVFLVGIGIVGTHRIAGPLFAIKRHMNRVRTGKLHSRLQLRRGDELQDIAASLNALLAESWDFELSLAGDLERIDTLLGQGRASEAAALVGAVRERIQARHHPGPQASEPAPEALKNAA
jgi:methyl-accepting chemotaxis protein